MEGRRGSTLKAHGNFRQKCKINWQIYANMRKSKMKLICSRRRWVQGAHDEDDDDDGIAGSLLLEGVCLFCVSAIFELIFANLCPKAENVATKYLNMPRVRTANEMAYTTAQ